MSEKAYTLIEAIEKRPLFQVAAENITLQKLLELKARDVVHVGLEDYSAYRWAFRHDYIEIYKEGHTEDFYPEKFNRFKLYGDYLLLENARLEDVMIKLSNCKQKDGVNCLSSYTAMWFTYDLATVFKEEVIYEGKEDVLETSAS